MPSEHAASSPHPLSSWTFDAWSILIIRVPAGIMHGLSTFRPPCTRCSWDRASHEPRHSKETFDKAGRQVSSASTLAASFVSPLSYLLPSQHPAFSTSKLYPPSLATDTTATRSLDWPYLRVQATKRRSEDCLTQKGQPESPRPPA